jgi:putative flippase GtrA
MNGREPLRPKIQEFLNTEALTAGRFAIVGSVATATHAAGALVMFYSGMPAFPANAVGFILGFGVSFAGHHLWSFRGSTNLGRRIRRFFALALLGFLVNSSTLAAWLAFTPWPQAVGLIISNGAIPGVTYVGARLWAFRETGQLNSESR